MYICNATLERTANRVFGDAARFYFCFKFFATQVRYKGRTSVVRGLCRWKQVCFMDSEKSPTYDIRSFQSKFGIALHRVLWWKKEEEMGAEVMVIAFDNKERLTLREEKQIAEAEAYFSTR